MSITQSPETFSTALPVTATKPAPERHLEPEQTQDAPLSPRGLRLVYAGLAAFVGLWGAAIYTFGLPGLFIPALALVPVMVCALVLIARP